MTFRTKQFISAVFFVLFCSISFAYGQPATSSAQGVSRLSTNAANASDPIVVGDNDPRITAYQNIVSLGAKGDGTTDNTAALQTAINAGSAVMIPEGTFNFSGTLTLKKDSIIVGVGKKSILRYSGTGVAMQESVGAYQGGYDNLKLMNFTLTTSNYSQTGIELTNNYQVTISGVYIDGAGGGFRTAGIHLIGGTTATNSAVIRIIDGEIWFCVGDGIRLSGPGGTAAIWIERNHITGNGLGIEQVLPNGAWPSTNFQINNNVIEGNINGGILAEVLYASSITGNYFENIDGSSAVPVRIANNGYAQGLTISGNLFGGKSAAYNIDMNGPADITGTIANNMFGGASVAAIRVNTARGLVIENNTLETGTVPTLVSLGAGAKSVWLKDANGASYLSGSSAAQPNLTLGGKLVLGSAALGGNAGTVESKTASGSAYAPLAALNFKLSAGPTWTSGTGAPASSCARGSLYSRLDGGAKTTLYVCESTGWVAK